MHHAPLSAADRPGVVLPLSLVPDVPLARQADAFPPGTPRPPLLLPVRVVDLRPSSDPGTFTAQLLLTVFPLAPVPDGSERAFLIQPLFYVALLGDEMPHPESVSEALLSKYPRRPVLGAAALFAN